MGIDNEGCSVFGVGEVGGGISFEVARCEFACGVKFNSTEPNVIIFSGGKEEIVARGICHVFIVVVESGI